jgi:replicative DNA helicase
MAHCFDDDDEAENILDKAEKLILAVGEARTREICAHPPGCTASVRAHRELSATQSNFTGIETGFDDRIG